jgi:hypothetical protein
MVLIEKFKSLVFSFPGVIEYTHFDRRAFKTKRIFVTLHEESRSVNFMFSPEDQADFCSLNIDGIAPLPNKWGLQGVTCMELDKVDEDVVLAGLEVAYNKSIVVKKKTK